jgi:hypothetical protein
VGHIDSVRIEIDIIAANTGLYRCIVEYFRESSAPQADRGKSDARRPREITFRHNLYAKIRVAGFSIYFIL